MAYGEMTQLAASVGDINTADNLNMVESYGKAIIVNGANKKVADFINSKLATADVGANPPDFGSILTGGSSAAEMRVDFITTLSGACVIYGYRSTDATFTTGETVTGLDDDGNAISFVISADEAEGPFWYDLDTYGSSDTYGEIPDRLYLAAMYLGRLYTAGDPVYPHQWYATRQGNTWDWLFNVNDVQSACTGGDVAIGVIQDMIRALVPSGIDYLLFGCANSIYAMVGDPTQGGAMQKVSTDVGMFGAQSWCFDDNNQLYFYGTGGIYRVRRDLTGVELMTQYVLPKIIKDEAADPSTHRITMAYDFERHGLAISIVNLTTRVNSSYWYEKRTDAFYPEQYPTACSPFSMLYHHAATPSYRGLLYGCSDGYIRTFDETQANDDIGGTEEAIDSYVTLGPFALSEDMGGEGIVGNVWGIVGGGATGGSQTDSSNVTYYVYVGDSPEDVMEKVAAGTHKISGTLYAPGYKRGKKQRKTARGKYAAIRFRNNTLSQSWAFEEVEVEIKPAGRIA